MIEIGLELLMRPKIKFLVTWKFVTGEGFNIVGLPQTDNHVHESIPRLFYEAVPILIIILSRKFPQALVGVSH